MIPGLASAAEQTPKKSAEQPLNRACEACRLSKVRCLVNPVSGSSQCQRCTRADRQCIFAPPAKRRQRKRTDVRVAELEREVKQLHTLLKPDTATNISPCEVSEHGSVGGGGEEEEAESTEKESSAYTQVKEGTTSPAAAPHPVQWTLGHTQDMNQILEDPLKTSGSDIIGRGIITIQLAEELLNTYRTELVNEYPGVVIPKDWTVEHLRFRRPALFHAVMAAASNSKGAALSTKLHEEVIGIYARAILLKAEKSIQYIQALCITVVHHTPPKTPAQLQVYLYCNMAASMAVELGLASKPRRHEQLPKRAIKSLQRINSAEELLENCRTILVLYTLTAGFSMRVRRPNFLLFNGWMEECQTLLQNSPVPEDRIILAYLRLQRIADETYTAFGLDDASTSFSLSELRVQATLRIFDMRMQDWKKSIPEDVMNLTLRIEYYMNIMTMWEFAMDGGHYDAPAFRSQHLALPALDDFSIQPELPPPRTALQINATINCISAAHSILDTFFRISIPGIQKAPSVVFVRVVYALITLFKADFAVGTDPDGIGAVLGSESLKVDVYLGEVLSKLGKAAGEQKCRYPDHWSFMVRQKLKAWHDEHMQWRRNGGHLKRGKMTNKEATSKPDAPDTSKHTSQDPLQACSTTALPMRSPRPSNQSYTHPNPQAQQQPQLQQHIPQQPLPLFNLNTDYTWPTPTNPPDAHLANQSVHPNPPIDTTQSIPGTFDHDMTDFMSAFQNGDFYLWNDIGDNFGGWIPQGDTMNSEMQFGPPSM